MSKNKRHAGFWVIVVFNVFSLILLLVGQTTAVFDYDLTVNLGLQEHKEKITEFGVQINRAFGAVDTVFYIPLTLLSLIGLFMKKSWSIITMSAVMGISVYWATMCIFIFLFLDGVSGYSYIPSAADWIVLTLYIFVGLWGIFYLIFKGDKIIE